MNTNHEDPLAALIDREGSADTEVGHLAQ